MVRWLEQWAKKSEMQVESPPSLGLSDVLIGTDQWVIPRSWLGPVGMNRIQTANSLVPLTSMIFLYQANFVYHSIMQH